MKLGATVLVASLTAIITFIVTLFCVHNQVLAQGFGQPGPSYAYLLAPLLSSFFFMIAGVLLAPTKRGPETIIAMGAPTLLLNAVSNGVMMDFTYNASSLGGAVSLVGLLAGYLTGRVIRASINRPQLTDTKKLPPLDQLPILHKMRIKVRYQYPIYYEVLLALAEAHRKAGQLDDARICATEVLDFIESENSEKIDDLPRLRRDTQLELARIDRAKTGGSGTSGHYRTALIITANTPELAAELPAILAEANLKKDFDRLTASQHAPDESSKLLTPEVDALLKLIEQAKQNDNNRTTELDDKGETIQLKSQAMLDQARAPGEE
jgi:hypothetical protein